MPKSSMIWLIYILTVASAYEKAAFYNQFHSHDNIDDEPKVKDVFVHYKRNGDFGKLFAEVLNQHKSPTAPIDEASIRLSALLLNMLKGGNHGNNDDETFDGIEKYRTT